MTAIGTCALCQTEGVDLQDSHVIPRWAYKRALGPGSNDLVQISDGVALLDARQHSEHLLCSACEQTLGKTERYVSSLAFRDGRTRLVEQGHVIGRNHVRQIAAFELSPEVDVEALCRFGASVLWRGHISAEITKCDVGPMYAERLWRYLRGEADFPAEMSLVLTAYVPDAKGIDACSRMITTPTSAKKSGYFAHDFAVPGLHFFFATGYNRLQNYKNLCLAHSGQRVVMLATWDLMTNRVRPLVQDAEQVGKLARQTGKGRLTDR